MIGVERINEIPETTGLYFFYDSEKLIYVGKAKNLRRRIKAHFVGYYPFQRKLAIDDNIQKVKFIDFREVENNLLDNAEIEVIHTLKPCYNAQSNSKEYAEWVEQVNLKFQSQVDLKRLAPLIKW